MASSSSSTDFNIDRVYRAFSQVMDHGEETLIGLPEFVLAFRELAKYFNHLNIVFSFVAKDLIDKFDLLEGMHRNDPVHYRTVQSMIEHESNKENKTGLEALLRLLRALEFTYLFLDRALVSPRDSSSSPRQVAWDVYKETLHKRHTTALQMGIRVATATLPKRETMRQTFLRDQVEPDTAEKCFPLIAEIYQTIHDLYAENDFLELVHL